MFGSQNTLPYQQPRPLGQDYRRSSSNEAGKALNLIYGAQRCGCEFISDVFDILTESVPGQGKNAPPQGTNYFASFLVAVCFGPVNALHDLYMNGDPVFTNNTPIYPVALTLANNVATFQTANPHGLVNNQIVVVYNANQVEFNGEFTITVVSPTQFQYTIPGATIAADTATAVSGTSIYAYVKLDPIFANGADSTEFTIPDFGTATIYWGTQTQTADAYTLAKSGVQHPPYLGVCYIVFRQLYLGFNQTSVQNIEVVVARQPSFPWMTNAAHAAVGDDCNPACIAADLMLNPRYGLGADVNADFNSASFNAAVEQFFGEFVGFSPLLNRPQDLASQLNDILSMVDAAPVLDADGKLALAMQRQSTIRDVNITDANLTELANFTPEDWSAVINQTYLNFLDQDSGWQPDFVVWNDTAAIYGKDRADAQTLDKQFITNRALATKLVAIAGQLSAIPNTTGTLTLAFDLNLWTLLAPGNGFTFTYAARPALNETYRVTSRTIDDPANPVFVIEVSVDRSYLYGDLFRAGGGGTGGGGAGGIPPVPDLVEFFPFSNFAIVELPPALCSGKPAIAALVARDNQSAAVATFYLGANYGIDDDAPDSYTQLSVVTKFAFYGSLAQDYARETNVIDEEVMMLVQLEGVDLILPSVTSFDPLIDTLLVFVGGEIMSVISATLVSAGLYRLALVRGRFATQRQTHHEGDTVLICLKSSIVPLTHEQFQPGNTAQFKLTFGDRSLADALAVDYGITGRAWECPPPCALTVNGRSIAAVFNPANPINIAWILPDPGARLVRDDIFPVNTLLEFIVAGDVAHSQKVSWPAATFTLNWADISGGAASNFCLRATTVVSTDFEDVFGWQVKLNVTKL